MRITHFLSDILEYQLIFLIVLRTKSVKCYQRSQWLNHIGGNNLTIRQAVHHVNNYRYQIIYNLFNFTRSRSCIHPYGGEFQCKHLWSMSLSACLTRYFSKMLHM